MEPRNEREVADMTPYDLKSKGDWDDLLERFARQVQMTACLTDGDGVVLQCQLDRYPLCAAVRDNEQATTFVCSQCSAAMLAIVQRTGKPYVDFCDIGLLRVVVPLVRDGELLGQVTACGLAVADEDEELDVFLVSKQLGITEEAVLELAKSTPSGTEERVEPLAQQLFEQLNP